MKINETCDDLNYPELNLDIDYEDNGVGFFYNEESLEMVLLKYNQPHAFLDKKEDEEILDKESLDKEGRYWKFHKVISFWHYPSEEIWKNFIENLENKADLNIWNNNWLVEIPIDPNEKIPEEKMHDFLENFKNYYGINDAYLSEIKPQKNFPEFALIPVEKYIGTKNPPEEHKIRHLMSWEEKEKAKKPKTFGSHKNKPLNWKQAMTSENLITNFNKFINEKLNS